MKKLKTFFFCTLMLPFTVFATENGINNDNLDHDINGNTCMANSGDLDVNDALAAQNPACHMNGNTLNLSSGALGVHGPLTVNTQYSNEYGLVVNSKYTQGLGLSDALSFEFDVGKKETRFGFTWGHNLNKVSRLKLSVERLKQKMDFNFDSGNVREWVPQYGVGAAYQYLIEEGLITNVELGTYYAKAQSDSLDDKIYSNGGSNYNNYRNIAGAISKGVSLSSGLTPWSTAHLSVTANYDSVQYNRKYDTDASDSSGLGAGVKLTQLIGRKLKLDMSLSSRIIYDLYEAELKWLVPTKHNGRLELSLNAARTVGHGTPTDNRFGFSAGYIWGMKMSEPNYALPRSEALGNLAVWTANPAVHMAQVLATVDQRSVRLMMAPGPMMAFMMRALASGNGSYDVTEFSDGTQPIKLNVMNYVLVTDKSLVHVSPSSLFGGGVTYDSNTGLFTGVPDAASINSRTPEVVTVNYDASGVLASLGMQGASSEQTITLNVSLKNSTGATTPWANQTYSQKAQIGADPYLVKIVRDKDNNYSESPTQLPAMEKGVFDSRWNPLDSPEALFMYPVTGAKDFFVKPVEGLPGITCQDCSDPKKDHFRLTIDPPYDTIPQVYALTIRPHNSNGNGTPQVIRVRVLPHDPVIAWMKDIHVQPVDTTSIRANWEADSAVELSDPAVLINYSAVVAGVPNAHCTGNNTSVVCSGLEQATTYFIEVTASDNLTSTPQTKTSAPVTTYTGLQWPHPNVAAVSIRDKTDSLHVTWTKASTESIWQLQYLISVEKDGETKFTDVATIEGDLTQYNVEGLDAGAGYTVRVKAFDDMSPSITADVHASTNVGLAWPGKNALKANATQDTVDSVTISWPNNVSSGVGTAEYKLYYTPENDSEHVVTIKPTSQSTASYSVTGLPAQSTVNNIHVDAVDGISQPIHSNVTTATTHFNLHWSGMASVTASPVKDSTDSVTIAWMSDADTEVGTLKYRVHYTPVGGHEVVQDLVPTGDNTMTDTVTGLHADTAINYVYVEAIDDVSPSIKSNVVKTKTNMGLKWSGSQTLTAQPVLQSNDSIKLQFDNNAQTEVGRLVYHVSYTIEGGPIQTLDVTDSTEHPMHVTIDHLPSDKHINHIQVTARDGISQAIPSNVVSTKTNVGLSWLGRDTVAALATPNAVDSITISWKNNAYSELGHVVYHLHYTPKGGQEAVVDVHPGSVARISTTIDDLPADTQITKIFVVAADGMSHDIKSNVVEASTNTPLHWDSSQTLTATPIVDTTDSIILHWHNDAVSTVGTLIYVVHYTVAGASPSVENVVPTSDDDMALTIPGLPENTNITDVHVTAIDSVSPDVDSNKVDTKTNQPLTWFAPGLIVQKTVDTVGSFDVIWNKAYTEVGHLQYRLDYKKAGDTGYTKGPVINVADPKHQDDSYHQVLSGLEGGVTYTVRVTADDTFTSKAATIDEKTYQGVNWIHPKVVVSKIQDASHKLHVKWSGNVSADIGTLQFEIAYKRSLYGSEYIQYQTVSASDARELDLAPSPALEPGVDYMVRVRAVNGLSGPASAVDAYGSNATYAGVVWKGAVTGLPPINAKQILLHWNAPGAQSDYSHPELAYYYTVGSNPTHHPISSGDVKNHQVLIGEITEGVPLQPETSYVFHVGVVDNAHENEPLPDLKTAKGSTTKGIYWTQSPTATNITTESAVIHFVAKTGTGKALLYTVTLSGGDGRGSVKYNPSKDPNTATLVGLTAETDGYQVVVSVRENESDPLAASDPITASPLSVNTPQGLTFEGALSFNNKTLNAVDLYWPAAVDQVQGARVTYTVRVTGGPSNVPAGGVDVNAPITRYHLSGMSTGVSYSVSVSVRDDKLSDRPQPLTAPLYLSSELHCPAPGMLPISGGRLDSSAVFGSEDSGNRYHFAYMSGATGDALPAPSTWLLWAASTATNHLVCHYYYGGFPGPALTIGTQESLPSSASMADEYNSAFSGDDCYTMTGDYQQCYIKFMQ